MGVMRGQRPARVAKKCHVAFVGQDGDEYRFERNLESARRGMT
jgi:hypothetical protein